MSTLALDGVLPRSRSKDPTTSVDAGRRAQLTESQQQVVTLFELEGRALADHELVAVSESWGGRFTPQRIRSARKELYRKGRIQRVPVFRKTVRGNRAQVWALVPEKGA